MDAEAQGRVWLYQRNLIQSSEKPADKLLVELREEAASEIANRRILGPQDIGVKSPGGVPKDRSSSAAAPVMTANPAVGAGLSSQTSSATRLAGLTSSALKTSALAAKERARGMGGRVRVAKGSPLRKMEPS